MVLTNEGERTQYSQNSKDPQCIASLAKGLCYYIKQQWITKQLQQNLWQHINGITIQAHWEKKRCYGQGNTNMVAWDSMAEISLCNLLAAHHHWLSKAAAKFLSYGTNMKR